tara:strand:+ start:3489 stop:3674 length:186 start_codon:yes stop_codon:yes gene_type:complete
MPRTKDLAQTSTIILFYRHQIKKFRRIGIGNKTEHGVVVTEKLIKVTKLRLNQLTCRNLVL